MKKTILLVGVIFLTSFMTLTTIAFGEGKSVCVIEFIWPSSFSYYKRLSIVDLKTYKKVHIMESLLKKDAVNAALSYEKAGACVYTTAKDRCNDKDAFTLAATAFDEGKPICFVEEHNYSRMYVRDSKNHKKRHIMTSWSKEDAVNAALSYEEAGACVYYFDKNFCSK